MDADQRARYDSLLAAADQWRRERESRRNEGDGGTDEGR